MQAVQVSLLQTALYACRCTSLSILAQEAYFRLVFSLSIRLSSLSICTQQVCLRIVFSAYASPAKRGCLNPFNDERVLKSMDKLIPLFVKGINRSMHAQQNIYERQLSPYQSISNVDNHQLRANTRYIQSAADIHR